MRSNKSFLWHDKKSNNELLLQSKLDTLGIKLNIKNGHLFYDVHFKPLTLDYELVFIRHGETYGNCGQSTVEGNIDVELVKQNIKNTERRIYQGNVDTQINQLTELGKEQAIMAAKKMNSDFINNGWIPDAILHSPLTRAKDTALPFVNENGFHDRFYICNDIREMSFGSWDNRRVCDIPSNDPCHLFYLNQDALIKSSVTNNSEPTDDAENFCELLLRAYKTLSTLSEKYSGKKVVMYSHSMFGAACCILLGKGQTIENGAYLAFDGKRHDGSSYTMPNATPFHLNSIPKHKLGQFL